MKRALLGFAALLGGCYDLEHLTKNYNADGGADASVVMVDGGTATNVTLFAGEPGGSGSANGNGPHAFFDQPTGIALTDTRILVVDQGSSTVFSIDRVTNAVTRVSGSPWRPGNGPTQLSAPSRAVAMGNSVFITDTQNHAVRQLHDDGTLTIVGGTGMYGPCVGGQLAIPVGITTDGARLYVVDEDENQICTLAPSTNDLAPLTTSNQYGFEDGPPGLAQFRSPTGIAFGQVNGTDSGLYIVDLNNRLLRTLDLQVNDEVKSFAGTLQVCGAANGPPLLETDGTSAMGASSFCSAQDVTILGSTLYVDDQYSATIRSIDLTAGFANPGGTGTVVVAGSSQQPGYTDGMGAMAQFNGPAGMASYTDMTSETVLLVADTFNHVVRQVTVTSGGNTVTTLAGSAEHAGSNDGPATMSHFSAPLGVATDGTNVYVADSKNKTIRVVANGNVSAPVQGGVLESPSAVAWGDDGSLYVADQSSNIVGRMVGSTIVPVVANAVDADGGTIVDGGQGSTLANPLGLAVGNGRIYVADTGHDVVRVFATNGVPLPAIDLSQLGTFGCGTSTSPSSPAGLALDAKGQKLYIALRDECLVVEADLANGNAAHVLAGSLQGGADGVGIAAQFDHPVGLALDGKGALYVADSGNATIRRIDLASATVTTYAGVKDEAGIVTGPAPAQLNRGFGLAYVPSLGLVASMPSENALVLIQ